jgi:hypothetical protein
VEVPNELSAGAILSACDSPVNTIFGNHRFQARSGVRTLNAISTKIRELIHRTVVRARNSLCVARLHLIAQ